MAATAILHLRVRQVLVPVASPLNRVRPTMRTAAGIIGWLRSWAVVAADAVESSVVAPVAATA